MTLTPKPLILAVLYALAEQRIGWQARNLLPQLTLREGLVLSHPEA